MVVQRGTSTWTVGSAGTQQQHQQAQQQSPHFMKHGQDYDTNSVRASSVVVTDSSALRCNVVVPSSAPLVDSQTQVEWKNTFNMRQVTLSNLAVSQLGLRPSHRPQIPVNRLRGSCITSTAKSLDILRQNIQSAINKEIDAIIKKYLEKFFQPAVDNIKSNLGASSVSEEHVRDVCRQILEDAKQMYCSNSQSRGSSPFNEHSDSETGSIGEYRFGRPNTRSPLFRKRKESDTDSEASQSARKKRSKPRPPGNFPSGRSTPLKIGRGESIRRDGPKWDPARIGKETVFVMGARANKVLGFGQTRGRLYIKHPGLFKYSGDQEDKEWLSRHNLMPPTGGKAYLMVLEDIRELAETDDYRNNPNLLLHELKGFHAPGFMLKKIRAHASYMRTDHLLELQKPGQHGDLCDGTETGFAVMQSRLGLAVDCISSAMTPPATVLDSGPPTPSETALDLLECPTTMTMLTSQNSDGSPYMNLQEVSPDGSHHNLLSPRNSAAIITSHGLVSTSHHNLVTAYTHVDTMGLQAVASGTTSMSASHATLSALLAGQIASDNSQEGLE
ncbi:hypothetical protein B7P43_G12324 [Cryptotermes secundus]|uniref:Uncharacterized protein n=2 Tax=Cryptotermes secundus TaxID=105785 RepID=A0A2J7RQ17_9NEOP|nr:uncharacterized protein LOC111865336 isoform X3 [Cryptotermes secundus]XP_023709061.1 uncharacterized protein LOC111865336 isoform X3 [Cryptotermes secundus]PNF42913.1 hypothetical protein B7P43_G12324 [Cryptotermes secundus]